MSSVVVIFEHCEIDDDFCTIEAIEKELEGVTTAINLYHQVFDEQEYEIEPVKYIIQNESPQVIFDNLYST